MSLPRSKRPWVRLFPVFLAFGLLIQSDAGAQPRPLTVAQLAGPRTFNFLLANDEQTNSIAALVMGNLINVNRQTQQLEPGLAERWRLSRDGKTLTMSLRQNAKFSDGAPFTAADVLFTLEVLYDEKLHPPLQDAFLIAGRKITAERLDDRTVRFRLPAPLAAIERIFDGLYILPRHKLEAAYRRGEFERTWSLGTPVEEIVGTGPYRLQAYVPGQRTVLARNPHYWKRDGTGHRLPYLDTVIVEIVPSRATQLLKFQKGEIDILSPVSAEDALALREEQKQGRFVLFNAGPSLIHEVFWFNLQPGKADEKKRAWFEDRRFRQAVAYAVDREAIIRNVFLGMAHPVFGPTSEANREWFYSGLRKYSRDLSRARTLLSEAGFRWEGQELRDRAGNAVEFTIIFNTGVKFRQNLATVLQEDLAALGIKASLVPLEGKTLLEKINRTFDYDACLLATASGDTDPVAESAVLRSSGTNHWWFPRQERPATSWEAEIDRLVDELATVRKASRRRQLYNRVQMILSEEVPFIYLVARDLIVAADARLVPLRPALLPPFAIWNLEELHWK
ncbi:MAG TPA: ABC transporter substrate-binding protein [Candidatus Acidoferrales bacterium]